MTWISLICLLALTSSAFGRSISAYGSYDASPQTPLLPSIGSQRMIPKTILPTNTLVSQTYGQTALPTVLPQRVLINTPMVKTSSYQQQQPMQQSYGAQVTVPRTLPVQSYTSASQGAYGAVPMTPQLDQPVPVPVLSQADILCQGHHAEDIIPIENNRKFVICLDKGKGVEQECPTGLFFHPESRRCERTSGPLDDACSSQPCLNGGQCLSSGSSFQCQCAAGFEGVVCELDARICQTQQPCGLAPDTKCQSFRLGAALPYICIFQNGRAYGLNTQQILPSPCHGTDGPQALAVSRSGFVMCDSERFFVESCPGGTIWDDVEKACSWPDQQSAPQEPKTLPSAYGYGSQMFPQQQPVQSYGSQTVIPQQTQMVIPKQLGSLTQSYGAQPVLPQQQPRRIIAKQLVQPMQSYSVQTLVPPQQQPVQSYGSQTVIPQQQPTLLAAKPLLQPMQSYGAQVSVSQPLTVTVPKQLVQPTQSYGGNVQVSQGQPTMNVQQDVPTLQPGNPYGTAAFPSS